MVNIVFFSNVTRNTERFVSKLELDCTVQRIPVRGEFEEEIDGPYVLITPTYNERGIPIQVKKFLSKGTNRRYLTGVIAGGNKNFGSDYAIAGKMISSKCKVPMLYAFEIMGTPEDVKKVREGLQTYVV